MRDHVEALQDELARTRRELELRDELARTQDELATTRRDLEFAREELKVMRPQQTLSSPHNSMRPQQTREHLDFIPRVDCSEGEHQKLTRPRPWQIANGIRQEEARRPQLSSPSTTPSKGSPKVISPSRQLFA